MMNLINTIFSNTLIAFLVLISIIVVIHELGHFLVGRLCGIRVEEFSVGFGPKALSFKLGNTVYRLNWLPLGGYVRFYGADTSENISEKERESSILHAKLYKRMLVAVAGPVANFILSFAIMFGLYSYGITKHPAAFRVLPDSVAYQDGLRSGDKVLSIDGKPVSDWNVLTQKIATSPGQKLIFEVERDQTKKLVHVTPTKETVMDLTGEVQSVGRIGITPFFSVATIAPWKGQIFSEIGLQSNDKIISISGQNVQYLDQFLNKFEEITNSHSDIQLADKIFTHKFLSFPIVVERNQETQTIFVNLHSSSVQKWAKNVLKNKNNIEHTNWMASVASPELTIKSYQDLSTQDKMYQAQESLKNCGLKPQDTLRKIDDSHLFASQVDFYSWLEHTTNVINQNTSQFKNNSLSAKILVTNQDGIQSTYSCFLPIRHAKDQLNKEKLFIDFPVEFVASPITYPSYKSSGANFVDNLKLASQSVIKQTTFIYTGFKKLFSGSVPLSSLGGPIAIAGFAGDAAKAGFETFLLAMSLMSVNIGIFNLLPLPALDGGMLLLQFVELFYRKPLPQKIQLLIARIGIAFLLTLFLFVFYNDIIRFFSK